MYSSVRVCVCVNRLCAFTRVCHANVCVGVLCMYACVCICACTWVGGNFACVLGIILFALAFNGWSEACVYLYVLFIIIHN